MKSIKQKAPHTILAEFEVWAQSVYDKQKRWFSDSDMWAAYPYKKDGLTHKEFTFWLNEFIHKQLNS